MSVIKIGLITYDYSHLKTEQIVYRLLESYNYSLEFFALPFVARPARKVVFEHRPSQTNAAHPRDIATKYKIPYLVCESDLDIGNGCDYYLILGAGILSAESIEGKRVINSHPGVIPAVRGLDAFKWAILEKKPIGNTMHFISGEVDAGEILAIKRTDVFRTDTIDSFARRHYENELQLMANFEKNIHSGVLDFKNIETSDAKRRMPADIEKNIFKAFDEYKEFWVDR